MDNNIKCSNEDFVKFLKDSFSCDDGPSTVFLKVTGGSMLPFLAGNRDSVNLTKHTENIKKGDILLYMRDNGKCVLHRVINVRDATIDFLGDAQTTVEHSIKKENILAMCTSATRKGKLITDKSPVWLFYKYIWIKMIPLRIPILNFVSKIKHKK